MLTSLLFLWESTPWALTGRMALRLLGLGCSVPEIEVVVFDQPHDRRASTGFCSQVAGRLAESGLEIWCPETSCYRRIVSAEAVAEIVERTNGTPLLLRRRATATRIVVTLSSDPRRRASVVRSGT